MERQVITVDIAPGNSQVERLGSSQGDIGRPMGVYIIQNGVALDCSAYSAELYILKPDGKFYTTQATVDATEKNLIKWETALQETPVAGACAAQIRIAAGDDDIGTARFVEFVEAAPGDMGAASESEVALLTEYVRQARESATSAGRDATTASGAASSASRSASTASADARTATQAASAATAAAERAEEVEESIPADYSQLSDDVSGLKSAFEHLDANVITESAGPAPIVSIADGADGMPMRSVEVAIEPVQDLHGYDSPWPAGGGMNLADTREIDVTIAGCHITSDSEGVMSISGTRDDTTGWKVIKTFQTFAPGNYVFSTNNNHVACLLNYTQKGSTFTVAEGDLVKIALYNVSAGTEINETGIKVIIAKGNTAPEVWTPYSNVCPISGWTGAKVTRCGKNLVDVSDQVNVTNGTKIIASGLPTGGFLTASADISDVTPDNGLARIRIQYMLNDNLVVSSNATIHSGRSAATLQIPQNATDVKIVLQRNTATTSFSAKNVMVEHGQTASTYEPYQGETYDITFPSEAGTVYGGTLDVSTGKLVVDRVYRTFNGSESWAGEQLNNPLRTYYFITLGALGYVVDENIVCDKYRQVSITSQNETIGINILNSSARARAILNLRPNHNGMSVDEFKAWLAENPITCAYKITSTTVYQLTPTEIKTLLGENRIFADAGNVAVTYPADTKMYIDNRINSTRKLIAGIETGFTASKLYAVGDMLIIGDDLYKVTAQIASGATITVGTNVTKTTVAEQLLALANA